MNAVAITRAALAERGIYSSPAPVRIVHLGLGNFFRAHQAWYTAHASDAAEWGIAAFTGRSTRIATELSSQDGLYCLVERGSSRDRVELVTSVVETHAGADTARLASLVATREVAIITLTVTESGYRLLPDGSPDAGDPMLADDVERLRRGDDAATAVGRLVWALGARRRADAGPIAIVPCDNIPGNGDFLARGVRGVAALVDPELADWIETNVSFVTTSVDRITPKIDATPESVGAAGWIDAATVVTEPFSDWVLAGEFPAGRPDWASAGARFVDDIEPWEHRKLWLLNGAHSILAFAGLRRGLETVSEAIAHPECRDLVDDFWAEAVQNLPVGTETERYREQLIERFSNPRIVHRLSQIAEEATNKTQFRFAAVAERTVAAGRDPRGSARALAAWIDWMLDGPDVVDGRTADAARSAASDDPVRGLLELVSPMLASRTQFVDEVRRTLDITTRAAIVDAAPEVRRSP